MFVARRQRHLVQFSDVPSIPDDTPAGWIAPNLVDDISYLIDLASVRREPPLTAIHPTASRESRLCHAPACVDGRASPVGMTGVEGEESTLPYGTLSLFDRSLLVSLVLRVRGSAIRPELHSAAAATTQVFVWIIACTSIVRVKCPSMKARAVETHAATTSQFGPTSPPAKPLPAS